MKTLYDILGVDRHASSEDVTLAFKRQVDLLREKLDKNDDTAKNALFNLREAYATLINSDRRSLYDARLDGNIEPNSVSDKRSKLVLVDARFEVILIAIPLFGALSIWGLVKPVPLLFSWILLIAASFVVTVTAFVAAFEIASRQHAEQYDGDEHIIWLVAITLVWIVAYPLYMWRRLGKTNNRAWLGVALTVVFSGLVGWRAYQIDQAERTLMERAAKVESAAREAQQNLEAASRQAQQNLEKTMEHLRGY